MSSIISVFAPATVANVGPCFDMAGFATQQPGDLVRAELTDSGQVEIVEITGDSGKLPYDPTRNTAGVVATEILKLARSSRGVRIWLHKQMPLFSGLGSSAASGAAAAVAVNELLGRPFAKEQLLPACGRGEEIACGVGHLDNTAPSLLGGLILIHGQEVERVELGFDLKLALVTPDAKVATEASRAALTPIRTSVEQHAATQTERLRRVTSLAALAEVVRDNALLESARGPLIPGFSAAKQAGISAGALAVTISGSGPSVFALAEPAALPAVAEAIKQAFGEAAGLTSTSWITQLDPLGARVVD